MMDFNFPIEGVKYIESDFITPLSDDFLVEDGVYISQNEIQFDIEDFGVFAIKSTNSINFSPYKKETDEGLFDLYISGPVLGAVLFQKKILSFHGSSFEYQNKGILFCGESGAGKSTTALSFCKDGAKLLNDDVSPVLFKNNLPQVLGFSNKIRLWKDTFDLLKLDSSKQTKIWSEDNRNKFYLELESYNKQIQVCLIFVLELGNEFKIKVLTKNEALIALHKQIYRMEFLKNMKETEIELFKQIISLTKHSKVIQVVRMKDTHPDFLKTEIDKVIKNL